MNEDGGLPDFACRCLNVRIYKRQPGHDVDPQEFASPEPGYQPLFVGEDGINVRHNQLTLRTRAIVTVDPSSLRRTQRTFIICLVCTIAVYCVTTELVQDADVKPGPVLPTEDWAERDTLTSKTGWIEVHFGINGCIDGKEVERISSSSSYSQYFSVDIASAPYTDPASHWALTFTRLSIPSTHTFLPDLPTFLPPPPFTPSHPIFYHLAALATGHSDNFRSAAEKRVYDFAKQQLAELEAQENKLKEELEKLWRSIREELKKYERERDEELIKSWQTRRRSMSPRGRSSSLPRTPAVIREFVPSTYSGQRMSRPTVARQSALSASLATSTFHHPAARQEETAVTPVAAESHNTLPSPPPYVSSPSSPVGSVGSLTPDSGAGIARSLRRNMNESVDAAVTYRWYVIEEQEAERRKARERKKREEQKEANKASEEKVAHANTGDVEKGATKLNDADNITEAVKASTVQRETADKTVAVDHEQSNTGGKKGKRHVSFKSEPAVVTIKREVNDEKGEDQLIESTEDLIFDIDDTDQPESLDDEQEQSEADPALTLPLVESSQEVQPRRTKRQTMDLNNAGLPQSFAALRPSSLPAPSNIRPPIRSITNGKRKSNVVPSIKGIRETKTGSSGSGDLRSSAGSSDSSFVPYQTELLKLVAADSPSHRGSWSRDSDSWKIFNSRRGSQSRNSSIAEEDETDENNTSFEQNGVTIASPKAAATPDINWSNFKLPGLPSSVPVPLPPVSQLQLSSNGRSLQPKTSLTERRGTLVPPLPILHEEDEGAKKKSPAAMRKATYVARDRLRAMDPGVLDFIADEDEEDELTSSPSQDDVNLVSTSRGRQHALKILRAGSFVPDAGLWRSLA